MTKRPEVGDTAPDFTATAFGGECCEPSTVTLSDMKGQKVILVFYPKDDTPGCTKQACEIRDGWAEIADKATVFGVSIDGIESHSKFIEKYDLPYALLSDPDKAIVNAYGVWVEKSLYGNKYMGTERSTFVIGKDGVVAAVLPKISPGKHFKSLLSVL